MLFQHVLPAEWRQVVVAQDCSKWQWTVRAFVMLHNGHSPSAVVVCRVGWEVLNWWLTRVEVKLHARARHANVE